MILLYRRNYYNVRAFTRRQLRTSENPPCLALRKKLVSLNAKFEATFLAVHYGGRFANETTKMRRV